MKVNFLSEESESFITFNDSPYRLKIVDLSSELVFEGLHDFQVNITDGELSTLYDFSLFIEPFLNETQAEDEPANQTVGETLEESFTNWRV